MGAEESSAGEGPGSPWRNRRKRIVAREVAPVTDVAGEMTLASQADLNPAELIDKPRARVELVDTAAQVVDPTQLVGERHRRYSSHVKYRATQCCVTASLLAAAVGIACILTDERLAAQVLGGVAVALAVGSVGLVRSSRLAYRLRGYAAAAGILAVLALVGSFLPNPFPEDTNAPAGKPDVPNVR